MDSAGGDGEGRSSQVTLEDLRDLMDLDLEDDEEDEEEKNKKSLENYVSNLNDDDMTEAQSKENRKILARSRLLQTNIYKGKL